MPPDPNAPTPGTENEPGIDYDTIEKVAKAVLCPDDTTIIAALDPATILALVRKARQRDAAERGIGDCIKEISVSALTGEIPDRAFTKGRLDGLGFALDALRKA